MVYKEIPDGLINGVNSTYTVDFNVESVIYAYVDGDLYTGTFTVVGNSVTLDSASPSTSITISYEDVPTPVALATGSSLAELKLKLNHAIGTTETNLYTEEQRTAAINDAVRSILEVYPIPQYMRNYDSLRFNEGVSMLPVDMLQPFKIYNATSKSVYNLIPQNEFDNNIPGTATTYMDEETGIENIKIYQDDSVTLSMRYTRIPADLSVSTDRVSFYGRWDKAIAQYAAYYLLSNKGSMELAQIHYANARDLMQKAWNMETNRYSSPSNNKLESVFETQSILGNNTSNCNNRGYVDADSILLGEGEEAILLE